MIKLIGQGYAFLATVMTEENVSLVNKLFDKASAAGDSALKGIDNLNAKVVENTDKFCEVLDVEFLDKESLKKIFDNFGAKEFYAVAMLKGQYDSKRDKRVFFIQKLDEDRKPINEFDILCLFVNNIDSGVQEWFGEKEMIIIKK